LLGDGNKEIHRNHAYVLRSIVGNTATFYNPWGGEDDHFAITLNNAELQRCFGGGNYYISL